MAMMGSGTGKGRNLQVTLTEIPPGYGADAGWVLAIQMFGRVLRLRRRMSIKPRLFVTFRKVGDYQQSENFVHGDAWLPVKKDLPNGWVRL